MQIKIRGRFTKLACAAAMGVGAALVFAAEPIGPQQPWSKYKVHQVDRPAPPVVTPGTPSSPEKPGKPPSDAIVLFDGADLSKWQAAGGGEPTFTIQNGIMLSTNLKDPRNNKGLATKQQFGDVQLHVEFATPTPPKGESQARGNSGIFLMGKFETQVLDNYQAATYPDGQCGAIYGQYPPMVNACLPPGAWQTYDIIFTRPRYEGGKLKEPAYFTTIQNGVLLQNHQRVEGPTGHMIVAKYPDSMSDKGPIELQYHNNAVMYRNIWIRPLEALDHQQHTGEVAQAAVEKSAN